MTSDIMCPKCHTFNLNFYKWQDSSYYFNLKDEYLDSGIVCFVCSKCKYYAAKHFIDESDYKIKLQLLCDTIIAERQLYFEETIKTLDKLMKLSPKINMEY